jgi:glucokinase
VKTLEPVLLIGDIGGTNARFAIASPGVAEFREEMILKCKDFAEPILAIRHFLDSAEIEQPDSLCLAVAGPVRNGAVSLTNNHWHISCENLASRLNVSHVRLLNDFEAIAYSLPAINGKYLQAIGLGGQYDPSDGNYTLGVVGPGTGLGAASLVQRNGRRFALVTEAGHVGFAPENALQRAVWEILRQRFGRVSDERLVSGQGISNLHMALADLHAITTSPLSPQTIFEKATEDKLCSEAVGLFFDVLGQVAGNFVLASGALDGLFIAGGIVQRYPELLSNSGFRSGFENKGRHRHIMEDVPTWLICHPQPGLLGASVIAEEMLQCHE